MAEITLLRHGQASFGADNYDQLSDLGQQQALWLGQSLKKQGKDFDCVVMGTMERHRETAQAVLDGLETSTNIDTDSGFNEYDFEGLLDNLKNHYPEHWHNSGQVRRDYFENIKKALLLWMEGRIQSDNTDSWQMFCSRIHDAFSAASCRKSKRLLIVTSAGPISVILRHVLNLDNARTRDLNLQIKNSSTSTLLYNRKDFALDSFNNVSHLLRPDKQSYVTFS